MIKFLGLCSSLLMISCNSGAENKNKETTSPKLTVETPKEKKEQQQDSIVIAHVMTYSKAEALKRYGTPITQKEDLLANMQGEFWNGIQDAFQGQEHRGKTITIEELTWKKDKNQYITVWYHKTSDHSIPKEMLIWEEGDEF